MVGLKLVSLLAGLSVYLGEGLNYAQLGPFFPTNAEDKHGISATWVGVITAAGNIGTGIGVWLFSSVIRADNQKYFFCMGAFVSSSAQVIFGVIGGWTHQTGANYISLCLTTRLAQIH